MSMQRRRQRGIRLLALVLAVLLALALAACGAPAQSPAPTTYISLATGGTAGTYYPLGGAMATIWTDKVPGVQATAESTGASVANARLLHENQADLALLQNDIAYYALNGIEMFDDGKIDALRGVATLYPETIQIVALRRANIATVADLRGKRVAVGARGSGTEANARQIMAAFGLSYADLSQADFLGFGDAVNNLKDGHLDAAFVTAGIPTGAITDIASTHDIVIVSVTGPEVAALQADYPFYTQVQIPAGTYRGQDQAVDTVAVMAMLAIKTDISDDMAYNLTKALFENLNVLVETHQRGADVTLETALDGMSLPLHPGVERYYQERGRQ